MANVIRYPQWLIEHGKGGYFSIEDDFTEERTDLKWIDTITDTGTVEVADGAGGIMTLTASDGTTGDNDEAYIESAVEIFKWANGKPCYAETRLQYTEVNTDDANVIFGFMNAPGANSLVDDGGGPQATFDGAVIYKIDGGTVWRCKSSRGTTATDNISTTTAGGASYQVLGIEVLDYTSTECKIAYTVDGVRLRDATTGLEIVHTRLYASNTEVAIMAGVKNGGTTGAGEVVNLDYIFAGQVR